MNSRLRGSLLAALGLAALVVLALVLVAVLLGTQGSGPVAQGPYPLGTPQPSPSSLAPTLKATATLGPYLLLPASYQQQVY